MSDKSPSQAMTRAIERARELLFPARLEKWLTLGFIAFLAGLGEGGSSYSYRYSNPFPGGSGKGGSGTSGSWKGSPLEKVLNELWIWTHSHVVLVVAAVCAAFLVGLALSLLLCWLSSRGKLVFVESVIHDRYQVKEPWERLREPAWAVFKFRFVLGILFSFAVVIALGAGVLLALDDLKAGHFGSKSWFGVFASAGLGLGLLVPLGLISMVLEDFVIPVFYLRGGTLSAAWTTVRGEVLSPNVGPVILFYLLKAVLGVGFVLLGALTACLTCCIAALPYLSSVALLPAHVFFRSYSLYFLEELGVSVFPPKPPEATFAHYPQRFGS